MDGREKNPSSRSQGCVSILFLYVWLNSFLPPCNIGKVCTQYVVVLLLLLLVRSTAQTLTLMLSALNLFYYVCRREDDEPHTTAVAAAACLDIVVYTTHAHEHPC